MLGPFPIYNSVEVYNVFKMDVISEALSPWGTHPEFAAIRTQMLHECNVSDETFTRFESSLSPHEHGNLLDMVENLQLGVVSNARDLFIVPVQLKVKMVLDELAITNGRGSHLSICACPIDAAHQLAWPCSTFPCPLLALVARPFVIPRGVPLPSASCRRSSHPFLRSSRKRLSPIAMSLLS